MASLFFSTPVDIDVVLEDLDERQTVDVKLDKGRRERVPLYMDGESVKGAVTIRPKDGKRLEHTGIKVQFIGTIGKLAASLLRILSVTELTATGFQRCSTTEATTTNSYRSSKNWPPQASCYTRKPFPSTSRMSRNSTNHTTESM